MQTTKAIGSIILLAAAVGCGGAVGANADGDEVSSVSSALTTQQRKDKITAKYNENTWLGSVTNAYSDLNPPGGRTLYQGGSIFVGDSTNAAHLVYGAILAKYQALGAQSWKGYPQNDEQDTWNYDGRWNSFDGAASIYYKWGANEAFAVQGWIRDVWSWLHYEAGPLGFPVTDEYKTAVGVASRFENGGIYLRSEYTKYGEGDATIPVLYVNTYGNSNFGTNPDPNAPTLWAYIPSPTGVGGAAAWYIRAHGTRWTPGAQVVLTLNYPGDYSSISTWTSTVGSDGVFRYNENNEYNPFYFYNCHSVNGVVTIQAREVGNSAHTAIVSVSRPTDCPWADNP